MKKTQMRKLWIADQGDGTYRNPILYTDYSDPDVIRVGDDFFMVASSFCNTPAVPLLHSKDLVNWQVINYIMDRLPFARYEEPVHGCGAWAPSIRYHEGSYYVFIPFPDEGIMMCKTTNPWGKWSEPSFVRKVVGWIDPCPFWDEDGKAYMVTAFARSRIGFKSMLYMSPMEPDCSGVLEDGQFIYDGRATQPTIEGPKLYKRNGFYYIFAPAGGVASGWQTVLRSRNIYGPYEEKIVLHQGNSPINGPHQGAWIDTPTGEDWFIHFQDVGNAGRILHLQPMRWEEDWPVIGVNAVDGCGEPVLHYRKPDVGAIYPCCVPEDSDFFEDKLGLQWQWNANYREDWYRVEKGLTLFSMPVKKGTQICDVPNLLLQKWPAPDFEICTNLRLGDLQEGDITGVVSLGAKYVALTIEKRDGKLVLQQRIGNWAPEDECRVELCHQLGEVTENVIYVKLHVERADVVSFEMGYTDREMRVVGEPVDAAPGRWVGVKVGLFVCNQVGHTGGCVQVDSFVFGENGKHEKEAPDGKYYRL